MATSTLAQLNAAKINGTDMVLLADSSLDGVSGPLIPVMCGLTLSLQRQLSTQDNSSKCGDDISPDKETSTSQFNGYILNSSITDKTSLQFLHNLVTNKQRINWQIAPATGVETTGMYSYSFYAFISNIQDTYDNDKKATCQFTVTISGGVTVTTLS